MYNAFLSYIARHSTTPLTNGDIEVIRNTFIPKKLRRRQYFLQEGEICKCTAFIVKGAMRQYSIDEKGAEHIIGLAIEDWWAVDRESFSTLTPSAYNIDAWEDSEILVLHRKNFEEYLISIPAIAELVRTLDERHASAVQKRLNSVLSDTAERRYLNLIETYPELIKRFPQHVIASYLGITKETLSRIRSQAVCKSKQFSLIGLLD